MISMGKNLDQLLLETESKLPYFVKEYSKRISSTSTIKTHLAYLNDILTFMDYCATNLFNKQVKDITTDDLNTITDINIYDYLGYLGNYTKSFKNKSGDVVTRTYTNSESGKCRKLSAVKSLFKKLHERKEILNNPLLTVNQNTPAYVGIRERLTKDEVQALEAAVMEGINIKTDLSQKAYERNKFRDTALMLIFLYSGIRVSELANLDIKDVDISNSTMTVIRKGNKRDKIPFPDIVADYLQKYIVQRKNMPNIYTNALFISQFKERISAKSINNIVKKYAARANITKPVTPHTLRRTCLTAFYNATKDIDCTKRLGGHTNVNTTLKFYASASDDTFKDQVYKFNYYS